MGGSKNDDSEILFLFVCNHLEDLAQSTICFVYIKRYVYIYIYMPTGRDRDHWKTACYGFYLITLQAQQSYGVARL